MSELQIFNYGDIPVRTVLVDEAPWWVLKDVCRVLGITNHKNVSARLDPDEKGVRLMDPLGEDGNQSPVLGGPQKMTIINESGLYSLIFSSRLEKAKEFKRRSSRPSAGRARTPGPPQAPRPYRRGR